MSVAEFDRVSGASFPTVTTASTVPLDVGAMPDLRAASPARGAVPETAPPASIARGSGISWGSGQAAIGLAAQAKGTSEPVLRRVTLYDGYAIVALVEPGSNTVDLYEVRAGRPVRQMRSPVPAANDPSFATWSERDVAWQEVPGLAARTPGELGIDGVTSHVIIEPNRPFSPDLVIRVYVTGKGGRSGRIDYYGDGRVMRRFEG